ncbi:MAG TPA: Slp family lipoprotein [Candidatus Binatia bacterium]|nr:Slp family lipoprotein [Candidatus Binatia bacterium]
MRRLALVLVPLALAACTRPPANLAGRFDPVTVRDAQTRPQQGAAVRWGGTLVRTTPGRDQTCFEILNRPLDREARPMPSDRDAGRFIACAPGFYDPLVYVPGRDITVTGALNGTTTRPLGGYDYTYPRIDATTVHLWPERLAASPYPRVGVSIGGIFFP